jgi:hypothetical protein
MVWRLAKQGICARLRFQITFISEIGQWAFRREDTSFDCLLDRLLKDFAYTTNLSVTFFISATNKLPNSQRRSRYSSMAARTSWLRLRTLSLAKSC